MMHITLSTSLKHILFVMLLLEDHYGPIRGAGDLCGAHHEVIRHVSAFPSFCIILPVICAHIPNEEGDAAADLRRSTCVSVQHSVAQL